jgi:ATP adenylyltransferase
MNKYPYNNGHLMVVPYIHKAGISDLGESVQREMIRLTGESVRILKKVLKCEGANCGMNIGRVAGAGIADHVHMHVVPRWMGDSNFMPIIGDAKSMPEYLEATFKKLKPEFQKL